MNAESSPAEYSADLIRRLAEADELPDSTTVAELRRELETIGARLREQPAGDEFEEESECRHVLEAIKALGQDPSQVDCADGSSPTAADHAAELDTLGQYELLEKLGEGGMGAVYKARHQKLDKIVAIKVLPAQKLKDKSAVARFEREMRAVGKLDHPNIVRAMDAGEVDGTHFLVMEYVKGLDLSQISKQHGPLPIAEACELIRQAAVGLDEAFDNGMVHRDIKPSNLILAQRRRKPPVVKILDMGLALLSDAHSADAGLTTTGQMMGTLDYMAPEQGGDSKNVDIRADIYGLGASLYRLLCGEVIYFGEKYSTPVQKMMALAMTPTPPIQERRGGIPDELAAIVHRMLAKEPDARYATPQEIVDELEPFCSGADLGWLLTVQGSEQSADTSPSATEISASSSEVDTDVTIDRPGDITQSTVDTGCQPISASPVTVEAPADPSAMTIAPVIQTEPRAKRQTAKTRPLALRNLPPKLLVTGGAGLAGILLLLAAMVFFFQTPHGTLRVEINDPDVEVKIKGEDIVLTHADKEPIKLKAGEHTLIITRGDFTFETKQFELKKREATTVKVELLPGKVQVVSSGEVIGSAAMQDGMVAPVPDGSQGNEFALDFDGKSYVAIDSLHYDGSGPLTVEAWCHPTAPVGQGGHLISSYLGPFVQHPRENAWIWFPGAAFLETDEELQWPRGQVIYQQGKAEKLVHVAVAYDEKTVRLFVNGERRAEVKVNGVKPEYAAKKYPTNFRVGAGRGAPPNTYFFGTIDEVRISNVARYDKDFTPDSRHEPDKHTLALYHFDEGSGDVLKDSSGNNHHGKIVGAKWVKVDEESAPSAPSGGFALEFLGDDNKPAEVTVPSLKLPLKGPLTLEGYITLTDKPPHHEIMILGEDALAKLSLWNPDGHLGGYFFHRRLEGKANVIGRPVHAAIVRTGEGPPIKLFIDGRLVATSHETGGTRDEPSEFPFVIGNTGFRGIVDEVRVSNTARYTQDFTPPTRCEPDEHTLALFHSDEGSGDVLRDSSGNNHHGKIVGAKWVKVEDSKFDAKYDADRRAALAVLALGGKVMVKRADDGVESEHLDQPESLPSEPFFLSMASLDDITKSDDDLRVFRGLTHLHTLQLGDYPHRKNRPEPLLSDAGLAHLASVPSLRTLNVSGHPGITDAGLAHLAGLTQLANVSLADTNVTGTGFRHLRDCDELLEIVLHRSPVTDEGLAQLPALPNLAYLDLSETKITETSIPHFKQLPQLRGLYLSRVQLSDDGMAALARLKGLTRLSLTGCDIQGGWQHVSALRELTELNLYGNARFTDDDLKSLAGLTKLSTLNLLGTSVSDAGVEHLHDMKQLRELELSKTKVTETGVKSLSETLPACRITWDGGVIEPKLSADRRAAQWVLGLGGQVVIRPRDGSADRTLEPGDQLPETAFDLHNISLVGNQQVTDEDLANYVSGLQHLKWLWLRETNITDAGIVALRDLPNLQCVNLYNTKVGDETLKHLSQFPKIWELTLYNTNITDDGMAHVAALPNLKILFANTPITGDDGLRHVAGLTGMLWLHLGAKTTDEGLKHLANLRQLEELSLAGTQVTGSGFVHLREMSKLRNINAIATPLNPESLAHLQALPDLKALHLGVTNLSDDGLAHVKPLKLERLDLDRNPITDAGLEHLCEMKTLRALLLTRTEVTEAGMKKLSEALPACRIIWDGGVIEPGP